MTKVPLAIGIFIFFTTACKTEALEKSNIARQFVITSPNSTTVPLNGEFYTVLKNRTHVYINSTDANLKPCTITIDPFEDVIQGKMKVEVAFDREIFIWGVQSREIDGDITKTYYAFLWIDPWGCSYKSISVPESDDAQVQKSFLPRLIRYRSSYVRKYKALDIFFPSLQSCTPCAFSSEGIESHSSYFPLRPISNRNQEPFYILWMEPNYFYVQNLEYNRAVLQYLEDDRFDIIKQKFVKYSISTVAIRKSNIRNVGICTKKRNNHAASDVIVYEEVRCERLNSKLQTVVSISIPTSDHQVSSVSLAFDDKGNSYISFAEDKELRVYIFDMDGKMLQSYNLGEVDERFQQYSSNLLSISDFNQYSQWDVHGSLVGNEYCVVVEQMTLNYASPLHVVKCIDVKNYIDK